MHFFTEHNKLGAETNAYGPVNASETAKYNVTSRLALTDLAKAFACQTGRIIVVQSQSAADLVNVILKPSDGLKISFSKVQYYIYRGLLKSSFITTGGEIKAKNDLDNSDFIDYLWSQVAKFKSIISGPDGLDPEPDPGPSAFGLFSPPLPGTANVESLFSALDLAEHWRVEYNYVKEGLWIGNFQNSCGFEIITETDNQAINLNYVSKSSHEIDISGMPTLTQDDNFKIKLEREKILNYIDPAAFWGMYFHRGIDIWNSTTNKKEKKENQELYGDIISKYTTTKNSVYLEVRSLRGRSYNFNKTDGQISFDIQGAPIVLIDYKTDEWPIVIKNFPDTAPELKELQFSFNYKIDKNIVEEDINISAYCYFKNNKGNNFFPAEKILQKTILPSIIRSSQSKLIKDIPINSVASTLPINFIPVANYYKVNTFGFQGFQQQPIPIIDYYQNLWQLNRIHSFVEKYTAELSNYCYWKVSSKNLLVDLLGLNIRDVVITNKILFDIGMKSDLTRKPRRLYQAVITDASEPNKHLKVTTLNDGFNKFLREENYSRTFYDSTDFHIFKGTIDDGGTIINSLTFINSKDFELKQSYLQIGITEEEYSKLIYDSAVEPDPMPAVTHVPEEAQNIYLHLEEDISIAASNIYRKFKLGVRYEDSIGVLTIAFPTTDIHVYTVDGLYFFTKEYSDHQMFYEEFAKAKVYFRTLSTYNGEFGFDWLREDDNGDDDTSYKPNATVVPPSGVLGGYERFSGTDTNTQYESPDEAYKFLRNEYQNLPTQTMDQLYHTPYLNIYSKTESDKVATSPKPPHEVELKVLVEIEEAVDRLEFEYDKSIFTLDKGSLQDKVVSPKKQSLDVKIKISCKKDFNKNKYIRVFAKKGRDKKLAGQIIVCKNSLKDRKEIKFILVKVKTNINGSSNTGAFIPVEKTNLINTLYQVLINGVIEDAPSIFDLSADADYKIIGNAFGDFILNSPGNPSHRKLWPTAPQGMLLDVKNKFLNVNSKFKDYFTVFAFDEITDLERRYGRVEKNGENNVSLFNPSGPRTQYPFGLSHEVLHGLGLGHTHSNLPPLSFQKFIYQDARLFQTMSVTATDNIMSYNDPIKDSTWYWQWKIVKSNLK